MYFWNLYPFVRLAIILILGIVSFDQFPFIWNNPIQTLSIGILLLSILVFVSHKYSFHKLRHVNGILTMIIIFYFGGSVVKFKYHSYPQDHYSYIQSKISGVSGTIVSSPNERTRHFRYYFELDQIVISDSIADSSGKIHLYIQKDSSTMPLQYGDHLIIATGFYTIQKPSNPGEFNYKLYLERQGIYSQTFIKKDQFKVIYSDPPNQLLELIYKLRNRATQTIDEYIPTKRENGIAKALILGIKDYLDDDVKEAFSSTGAMHVLAVSGLHVGIVYLLIQSLFGKLRQSGKWGQRSFGLISILIIWLYAILTGLSPSVLRAATMFSLVAISQATVKRGNVYNTLGLAAFILLLFDPYLIYSVGFQLSFIAVLGIVYLHPRFYRLLQFQNYILDKAWTITCVSIAAQLATFPLSMYYFHQFPVYFLVSNLIVIPSSFAMLVGGMFMLIMNPIIPQVAKLIGAVLHKFIWLLNETIRDIQMLPRSVIEWIFIDEVILVSIYLLIMTIIVGLHFNSFKMLVASAFLCLFIIFWNSISNENQSSKNELILYEISGKTVIDHIQGHSATLYVEDFSEEQLELLSYKIDPHRLKRYLKPIKETITNLEGQNFRRKETIISGQIANKRIIIIDSTTFHLNFKKPIQCDLIIINNEAIKSLKWLTNNFLSESIIIGNKNSFGYTRRMKLQATKLSLPIHSLREDGAFTLSLINNKERVD